MQDGEKPLLLVRAEAIALDMADKSNGERLREWREAAGLTQADAAEKIGAEQGTWGPWEKDKKRPSVDYACAIDRLTVGAVPVSGWGRPSKARSKKRRRRQSMAPAA